MSRPLEDKNVEYDDSICIDFGFKPDEVKEAVQYLDKGDRDEVKKLGFGTFLDLSIGDFKQRHRQPIDSIVRNVTVEKDRIAICMRDGVILYLTPEIISL